MKNELEYQILKTFFERISVIEDINSEISEDKIVSTTQNQLKKALRGAPRCTCNRMTFGMICEVCQDSDRDVMLLRNFYNNIRNAKKHNMTNRQIQECIENTKAELLRPSSSS